MEKKSSRNICRFCRTASVKLVPPYEPWHGEYWICPVCDSTYAPEEYTEEAAPICRYCGGTAELVTGETLYPHRPDLFKLLFWRCAPCDAHVGCHRPNIGYGNGTRPLGDLANKELRLLRGFAHAAFDPLWEEGLMDRKGAYAWLAARLEISVADTHIGSFDEKLCRRTIELAKLKMED